MKSRIDQIKQKYRDALKSTDFQFGVIQEIVSEINALPISEKSKVVDFYKDIGQELFERGVSINNYDLGLLSDIPID